MSTVLDPALIDHDAEGALHPGALRSELPQIVAGYRKMKAFDKMTGDMKGWLGSTANMNLYMYDSEDDKHVAWVRFADFKDQKWLARDTTPNDRFLGLATQGYATWGLEQPNHLAPVSHDQSRSQARRIVTEPIPLFVQGVLLLLGRWLQQQHPAF